MSAIRRKKHWTEWTFINRTPKGWAELLVAGFGTLAIADGLGHRGEWWSLGIWVVCAMVVPNKGF